MTPQIKPLIAGNWKMNGTSSQLSELVAIAAGVSDEKYDALICTPATLLHRASHSCAESPLNVGGQDCHAASSGAHTGDISADMIRDAGATHIIVGHSERRTDHAETDEVVAAKAKATHEAGLVAVICIGETKAEREQGLANNVASTQIKGSVPVDSNEDNTVVAYEPVWAIGTGLVPSSDDIESIHAHIREELVALLGDAGSKMKILYGGSLKPANAKEILAITNVDGGLIGGASLKSADFLAICAAVE
jgi:triosephosphate isomerase